MKNEDLTKFEFFCLNEDLLRLIDSLAVSGFNKFELLTFAFEFVVKGNLIEIAQETDNAIDVLYPICRELRKLKSVYMDNGLLEFA